MRRSIAALMLAALAVVTPALAHEGHAHKLMGTVTAVHADKNHVEMKDTKGAAQSFYVETTTRILKGKDAVKLADLKPGTRVVVEATTTKGRMVASEIKLGTADPKAPEGSHKH
jgi:hypothetical protein